MSLMSKNQIKNDNLHLLALSPDEARVRCIADIVQALVDGIRKGSDVDLNQVRRCMASCMASSFCFSLPLQQTAQDYDRVQV